ncbi:uncharacterized protein CMC5_037470 [Chondromyces crocatus]|uniref:Uncharacterized protein n=1 Tax=Chondromyces crocatus TaxID=52 RepID=A0A0K1EGA2_CHOCO|nr:uncharacterized protein CMC5_037470 [Chondromyces crocatus]
MPWCASGVQRRGGRCPASTGQRRPSTSDFHITHLGPSGGQQDLIVRIERRRERAFEHGLQVPEDTLLGLVGELLVLRRIETTQPVEENQRLVRGQLQHHRAFDPTIPVRPPWTTRSVAVSCQGSDVVDMEDAQG